MPAFAIEPDLPMAGRVWKFGDQVSGDDGIIDFSAVREGFGKPMDEALLTAMCFRRINPRFPKEVQPGDLVVGGVNFAHHNHVEVSAAIRFSGIAAVLVESCESGFIRRALSQGLPVLTVSARTGKGLDTLIKVAFEIRAAWSKRVPTALLNRWFDEALAKNPPPAPGGKRIKLRYITQAKTRPPGFVLFGTRLDELPVSYQRYLINGIRRELGFEAVPVRLTLRSAKNPYKRD